MSDRTAWGIAIGMIVFFAVLGYFMTLPEWHPPGSLSSPSP